MDKDIPIVVVADNSPTIKTLFERSTEKLGIELIIFDSAENARTYLKSNKPDLLILSIILPDKDGLSFLKELRKLPLHQDTSVIMVSSKDYTQDREAADRLGALEFIPKPMSMQTITNFVVKYTEAKHTD
ncbi:MAG: response regulator [Gammaproteobacteria bacterium]